MDNYNKATNQNINPQNLTEDEERNLRMAKYIIDNFNLDPTRLLELIPQDAIENLNNKTKDSIKNEVPFLKRLEDRDNQLKEYEKNQRFKKISSVIK